MSDCKHCNPRRDFLKLGGMTLFISAIDPKLLRAAPELGRLRSGIQPSGKRLIHIWLRGGQDGLNVIVPTIEFGRYQSIRPNIALPQATLLPLDVDFAMNPDLDPGLWDLWNQGKLAVLPTVGYPDASRSHFDGQKFLENGTPWDKATPDGWLNRWLQAEGPSGDPLQAVSFTSSIPLHLRGTASVLAFSDLSALDVTRDTTRNDKYLTAQETAYSIYPVARTYDAEIVDAGSGLVRAIRAIESVSLPAPDPAASYPDGTFGTRLMQLAQLIKAGFEIEVANLELNGWDTHTQQQAPFSNMLSQLSQGILAFYTDLGSLMQDTLIMSVSEFGRTARENGNFGTDHGNAWVSFVVSENLNGGSGIHLGSGWPGLEDAMLRDNRDLQHTIDYRDMYLEVVDRHMGGIPMSTELFPGWAYNPVGFL